jgi:hypothetical protein
VLAKASRFRELFLTLPSPAAGGFQGKDCFGGTPKPTRETDALLDPFRREAVT